MPHNTYSVFISHMGEDEYIARCLARDCAEVGAGSFIFERDIAGGAVIDDEIRQAFQDADELLVLLTPESLVRAFVWIEIGMFYGAGKRITALLHRLTAHDVAANPGLPADLRGRNLVSLRSVGTYFEELQGRVEIAGGE